MEQTVDLVASGGRIVIVGLVKRGIGVTFPGLDFTRKEMAILARGLRSIAFPSLCSSWSVGPSDIRKSPLSLT